MGVDIYHWENQKRMEDGVRYNKLKTMLCKVFSLDPECEDADIIDRAQKVGPVVERLIFKYWEVVIDNEAVGRYTTKKLALKLVKNFILGQHDYFEDTIDIVDYKSNVKVEYKVHVGPGNIVKTKKIYIDSYHVYNKPVVLDL